MNMRAEMQSIFQAAIAAVDPYEAVSHHLRLHGHRLQCVSGEDIVQEYDLETIEHIYVVGAGKAAAPMARAVEHILGHYISAGCIIVKYGYIDVLKKIRIIEAAHPLPDRAGMKGAAAIVEILEKATENDLVISLISGGGSALMTLPVEGITLEDIQGTTDVLLKCGASIHEINSIRKHLSQVKGGGAARKAWPAPVINLMISDVVGDNMDVIASGPFVPDKTTFADAMDVCTLFGIQDLIPKSVYQLFEKGVRGEQRETPKQGDQCFDRVHNIIIASNIRALQAAASQAEQCGYRTLVLSSMIEGEAKDVAGVHAAIVKEVRMSGNPVKPPVCIISGGETTVTIHGHGLGGRNMEFAMHAAVHIAGMENICIASVGTDGGDGPTDAAGAIVDGTTLTRLTSHKILIDSFIEQNDSYHLFELLGDLVKTGPTNTNVMDVRILLVR